MPLPLPLPLPLPTTAAALTASALYLNARLNLSSDIRMISSLLLGRFSYLRAERQGRINLFYRLEELALSPRTKETVFLVFGGEEWTFRRVYEVVLRYARWLRGVGVGKETRGNGGNGEGGEEKEKEKEIVALDFTNCPQFLFLCMAIWSLGATPALINYNLTGKPLIHSVKVSTARILIVDPEVATTVTSGVEAELTSPTFRTLGSTSGPVSIIHFDSTLQTSLRYYPPYRAPDSARTISVARDPAILIYTSGTTGLPKPAIFSWKKMAEGGRGVSRYLGMRPTTHKTPDRFYICMPLYHGSAMLAGFGACLASGTTLVLAPKFSVTSFWPDVRENGVTMIQYVGETCRYLLAAPAEIDPADPTGKSNLDKKHKVRLAFGNGMRPDVWKRFTARFGIETVAEFYAATEGTSGCWNISRNDYSAGAVGKNGVLAGWAVGRDTVVVDVDHETMELKRTAPKPGEDEGEGLCILLPRGSPGEVLYRVDPADITDKFQGYFRNPSASAAKIVRNVRVQGDAWFRTGDVMRWDSEGRWWFVDRLGDSYKWKAETVSTAEVSEVLGLLEGEEFGLREANVYGVSVPGTEGRAGCVALLLDDDDLESKARDDEATRHVLTAVHATLVTSLPRYAVPVFIRLVRSMSITGSMKLLKHTLRQEGVDVRRIEEKYPGEEVWWLKPATEEGGESGYVRFTGQDWDDIVGGKARL